MRQISAGPEGGRAGRGGLWVSLSPAYARPVPVDSPSTRYAPGRSAEPTSGGAAARRTRASAGSGRSLRGRTPFQLVGGCNVVGEGPPPIKTTGRRRMDSLSISGVSFEEFLSPLLEGFSAHGGVFYLMWLPFVFFIQSLRKHLCDSLL